MKSGSDLTAASDKPKCPLSVYFQQFILYSLIRGRPGTWQKAPSQTTCGHTHITASPIIYQVTAVSYGLKFFTPLFKWGCVWHKQTSECKNLSLITKYQGGNCNYLVALFKTVYKQCLDETNSSVTTFKSCNKWKDTASYYTFPFNQNLNSTLFKFYNTS